MYKPGDLDVGDIVYVELKDDFNHVYSKGEGKIINIVDSEEYQYPIYIEWGNTAGSINLKYEEVVEVIEGKSVKELSNKPFNFINL